MDFLARISREKTASSLLIHWILAISLLQASMSVFSFTPGYYSVVSAKKDIRLTTASRTPTPGADAEILRVKQEEPELKPEKRE